MVESAMAAGSVKGAALTIGRVAPIIEMEIGVGSCTALFIERRGAVLPAWCKDRRTQS